MAIRPWSECENVPVRTRFTSWVSFAGLRNDFVRHHVRPDTDSLLFVWWNLQNLMDTVANSGPRDRDFLPDGPYRWDSKRYFQKLYALGRGLAAAAGGRIPDAIGVCEVENADVLDDLERRWPPAWRLWRLHRDSPDGRGIDVAVWYNPERSYQHTALWQFTTDIKR